jgi:hypothetical protein
MKPTKAPIRLVVAFALALGLALAPGAQPADTPLLDLGPVVVANGVATVTGTVASQGSNAQVTVNGQAVGLDTAGAFTAVVPLNGASTISIGLGEGGTGQQTTFQIPLTGTLLGSGGVIPAGTLDSLEQSGISLVTPVAGNPDQPIAVSGSVLDGTKLAGLSVNGKDVLGSLGSDGGFSIQVPGTTKVITLTATDTHGNSQIITRTVGQAPLAAPTTVSAAQAVGLSIAKVQYYKTAKLLRSRRVRMVVTVKDRRGLLVHGAKLRVRETKRFRVLRQPKASTTGAKGRATFVFRLQKGAFGKRLLVVSLATTPHAKVSRKTAVLVPKQHRKKQRKHR